MLFNTINPEHNHLVASKPDWKDPQSKNYWDSEPPFRSTSTRNETY